jgi:hypothetical protein
MITFLAGIFCGAVGLLLISWYMTKDAAPKAEPHQFSAVSAGGNQPISLEDELRVLRNGETQITRH